MTKTPKRPAAGLPDRDTLIAFLREAGEAEKADIARVFGLKGIERRQLREMLKTHFTIARPEIVDEQISNDGTRKWLLRFPERCRSDLTSSHRPGCFRGYTHTPYR